MKSTTLLMRLVVVAIGLSFSLNSCDNENLVTPVNEANLNTAAVESAKGGVVHHVSVGGADAKVLPDTKPGYNANFSLVANVMSDGSVKGQYTDQFGHGDGGFHAKVECVFIEGNQAWISGVVTSGTINGTDAKGLYVYTSVIDNGKDGDQISYSYLSSSPVDCTDKPSTEMFDVLNGQVIVR